MASYADSEPAPELESFEPELETMAVGEDDAEFLPEVPGGYWNIGVPGMVMCMDQVQECPAPEPAKTSGVAPACGMYIQQRTQTTSPTSLALPHSLAW